MEMDCNLKHQADVFKFYLCFLEKLVEETDYGLFFV